MEDEYEITLEVFFQDSKKPTKYKISEDTALDEFENYITAAQESGFLEFLDDNANKVVINLDHVDWLKY